MLTVQQKQNSLELIIYFKPSYGLNMFQKQNNIILKIFSYIKKKQYEIEETQKAVWFKIDKAYKSPTFFIKIETKEIVKKCKM